MAKEESETTNPVDPSRMREHYEASSLRRSSLQEDPYDQFAAWFEAAAADPATREPNAMTLSTVGLNGGANSRTILLKEVMPGEGFSFFTNYGSHKAQELEANSGAALLFFWESLERQVHIRGQVEKLSHQESEAYFFSRPYGSRIGAWVSEQSSEISGRDWLETREREFRGRYPDTEESNCVPLPPNWGGFRLRPDSFEFWQGQPSRLHDRFEYLPVEGKWGIRRLSP